MKKFNLKKMIAYVLVAVMTFGVFSMTASAAEVTMDDARAAFEAAVKAGIQMDKETVAELEDLVKEAAKSLDIVEEGADPAKSTFVSFAENPVKIVEYDGEAQSLRGVAVKTVSKKYVADTKNLYIGVLEDGTSYQSFDKPTEVGFYYVVCMYEGDANNYPSVGYGILVILPAEEETTAPEEETTTPSEEETTLPEEETTTPEEDTTTPEDDKTEAPAEEEPATDAPATDAPKTGDNSQIMVYAAATVVALGGMGVVLFKKRNA